MTESLFQLGVAAMAAVMGAAWFRNPKLRHLAWPAFGVAGVLVGLELKSDVVTQGALAITGLAMAGQIFFVGLKRRR
jgi:hypothetical protein